MFGKRRLSKHDFYYLGLFIYVLTISIQYSYAHNIWMTSDSIMLTILKLLKYLAYVLCMLHFFVTRNIRIYAMIAGIILFLFAVYATYTGPQRAPIFYFILLITGIKTDFKKCVKIFLVIQLTTFIIYVGSAMLGIMGADTIEDFGRTRSFLGYGWVNRASYCWFFICLELLYLKNNRFNFFYASLLGIVNYFIFWKTHTMFSMLMTFGVIGYGLFNNYYLKNHRRRTSTKKSRKRLYVFSIFLFIGLIILGAALPIVYNPGNPVMYQLNKMVTGRLALGKTAIEQYGLHLGGNKLQWVGSSTLMFGLSDSSEYLYVDNGFLQLALEFGLLFTGFVIFLYIVSIKKAVEREENNLVIIYLILALLFVFEPYVIDFAFNPFVLFFFSSISTNNIIRNPVSKLLRYQRG